MDINVEGYTIRKWYEFFEEACSSELGISADGLPVAKFGVGAVIQNPYAGRFSKDLSSLTEPSGKLGQVFGQGLLSASQATQ